MARDLHASMAAGLVLPVVRPVLIGRLDIETDPVKSWTGPSNFAPSGTGDTALDGNTFTPLGQFLDITEITEDQGIGGPVTITMSGNDLDAELLKQVVNDKRAWRGKPAYLWIGLLDTNEYSVIANPTRIKTGVMISMITHRDKDGATVKVTIDEDFGNSRSAPFRYQDHTRLFPSDTFGTYVVKLANKPQGIITVAPTVTNVSTRRNRDDD